MIWLRSGFRALVFAALLFAGLPAFAQTASPAIWKNECTTPWGAVIYGGDSVTAYQSATAPACGGCVSETRTCAGNYLDGSYTNQSCTAAADNCVFVTSTTYNGNLGGLAGADAKCAVRAAAAGLPGSYMAWIATNTDDHPGKRFPRSGNAYYLPSGTKVADNWTDLTDGTLDSAIKYTEFAGAPPVSAWTAVDVGNGDPDFSGGVTCSSWASTSGSGDRGSTSSNTSTWTSNGSQACTSTAGLYCFQCAEDGFFWTAQISGIDWSDVASSSDGVKLVATAVASQIYTSTDSGANWTARDSVRNWQAVASSSDGVKLVAVVDGGQIYTSTNSGVNWTARNSARNWTDVASSSDGVKLVAVVDGGQIYTSTDSGVNWTARNSNRGWRNVASSSDGTKLVANASTGTGPGVYTSTDSGVNWTLRDSDLSGADDIASSADGTKLVLGTNGGQIYTSTDSGVTWTEQSSGFKDWLGVASSADGTKLVAVADTDDIYTSADSGVTWAAEGAGALSWRAVASSSNGKNLVATELSRGEIFTRGGCPEASKLVFITSTTYDGNLGGVAGADAKCAARATAAGLSGTFLAWISTTSTDDPESRFTRNSGPYILTNGTKVADDWTDLTDGTLDAAINRTESNGGTLNDAWTAVSTAGASYSGEDCSDWSNNLGTLRGKFGSGSSATSTWTDPGVSFDACSATNALYCFQQ